MVFFLPSSVLVFNHSDTVMTFKRVVSGIPNADICTSPGKPSNTFPQPQDHTAIRSTLHDIMSQKCSQLLNLCFEAQMIRIRRNVVGDVPSVCPCCHEQAQQINFCVKSGDRIDTGKQLFP